MDNVELSQKITVDYKSVRISLYDFTIGIIEYDVNVENEFITENFLRKEIQWNDWLFLLWPW